MPALHPLPPSRSGSRSEGFAAGIAEVQSLVGLAPSRTRQRRLDANVLPICPTDCGSASYISAPP